MNTLKSRKKILALFGSVAFVGALFFFCSFIVCSCQKTTQNLSIPEIKADVTSNAELKLSEFFENFRMLKLPSDSVMGEISRIRYENSRIYISDGRTMFIFSDTGELLSCFSKRGSGPGEYSNITDFMVDGEKIIVLNRTLKRLLTFDQFGNSIATQNLDHYAQAISPTVDNSFFLYYGNVNIINYKLQRFRNGKDDSLYVNLDKKMAYLFIFADYNFHQYQKSIFFFETFNDIIYESFEGGGMRPSYYVDFIGKNIPASFFEKKYKDVEHFFNEYDRTSYTYGVDYFALYERFLMFGSYYQKTKKLTVYDRINHISKTFATIKDDVYFNGLTIPVSDFIYHANKHIIVPLNAFEVVEWKKKFPQAEQFKEIVDATKEEDNPILLIFDFKQ